MTEQFASVDAYVASRPVEVQVILEELRRRIQALLPTATETIAYAMPAFVVDGRAVVQVGAWKHHVSLYPTPAMDGALERRAAGYRSGQSTLKFPFQQPIPYALIEELVALLAEQRLAKPS